MLEDANNRDVSKKFCPTRTPRFVEIQILSDEDATITTSQNFPGYPEISHDI